MKTILDLLLDRSFPLLSLLPYILLALGLCGVLAVYFTLKREIAAQAKRNRRVESMLLRLREAAERQAVPALQPALSETAGFVPPSLRPGMNLSRRVQALRLVRRGEDLGYIATALGVPRREVELVVRVHQLTGAAATHPPTASQAESARPPAPQPAKPAVRGAAAPSL